MTWDIVAVFYNHFESSMEVRPKNKPGICPVCRDPIDSSSIFRCPLCGQAYHPNCWSYNNNQCGVLGCHGRTSDTNSVQVTRHPQSAFGAIALIGILCAIGGLLGGVWLIPSFPAFGNLISHPGAISSPEFVQTSLPVPNIQLTAIVLTSASAQPATKLPIAETPSLNVSSLSSQPVSPEQFIRNYFTAINDRQYELAWSMLSKNFQASYTYSEYTSWWNTLEKVEVIAISVKSQSNLEAFIYVEAYYYYKSGDKTTGHTTYKLVKNEKGDSWLFDPN